MPGEYVNASAAMKKALRQVERELPNATREERAFRFHEIITSDPALEREAAIAAFDGLGRELSDEAATEGLPFAIYIHGLRVNRTNPTARDFAIMVLRGDNEPTAEEKALARKRLD